MEQLDFLSFLKKYYPSYQIDGHNAGAIKNVSLWALRTPSFNKRDTSWHIDKGLCISGNYGTGKTELFFMLNRYLNYLKSPYVYSGRVVWKFAEQFKKDGFSCFDEINYKLKNIYFDELALVEDGTLNPSRELVGNWGDKALIGREIIMHMYNKFRESAYQCHFSTNRSPQELREIYGEFSFSRLHEMCNFIVMSGPDRRQSEDATIIFRSNKNQPAAPLPYATDVDSSTENILLLEQHYQDFLDNKQPSTNMALVYNMLVSYGVSVATDDELRALIEDFTKTYVGDAFVARSTPSEKERTKNASIWEQSRKAAVGIFFQRMKAGGATSIFGVKNVGDIDLPAFKG